ncbi:hypothetical protein Micbo1qcDRAFT_164497 [Microdochium bolleyi]|uniref:Uncharacterized protein n=1 Tax=Microdochium bolleyi TaxID=196109 RepID=A0A136IYJ9_9PEZI|nr:hypothetical protein Micbo1qcDRAFT_164497 [Microdochium bolleyi]
MRMLTCFPSIKLLSCPHRPVRPGGCQCRPPRTARFAGRSRVSSPCGPCRRAGHSSRRLGPRRSQASRAHWRVASSSVCSWSRRGP